MPTQDLSQVKFMGAAINGVVRALLNRDAQLADFSRKDELHAIQDFEFVPISLYLDFMDYLEQRLGLYAFLRLGRKVGATVMETAFPPELKSVEEAIAQIHLAHQAYCRPVIGAFEVTDRSPGVITMRYTAPYNCILQEGLFFEIAQRYGATGASVTHATCRRQGAPACIYEIRY